MKRAGIRVAGIVQGVGFRPFVYRLAKAYDLTGLVFNDAAGVWIEIQGEKTAIKGALTALSAEAPPRSQITAVEVRELSLQTETGFVIAPSPSGSKRRTLISPDIATCPDCRRELLDERDRRYGYPFINCTNCGPRYSIVRDVPYDRPQTTMASFSLCPQCRREYEDPLDRRFHAQPNACGDCGPSYQLLDGAGTCVGGEDVLAACRDRLVQGAVVAIKGIGGYHLACDARSELAVKRLRQRKYREEKPFAVMCGSLAAVKQLCFLSAAEEGLLTGPAAPIVLLRRKPEDSLAPAVAPGNPCLGVMLPYAPVHYRLLADNDVLVMTSGNVSEEPIAYEDEDARKRLAGIAEYFLVHNREIHCRVDDSVARIFEQKPYLLRRSRGYAPAPIAVGKNGPAVLACGGETKNTFCLTKDAQAFVSPHIGDLENQEIFQAYQETIEHYKRLFDIQPQALACDLHPEYLSGKYAAGIDLPLVKVQHHHAHIASVLAEHGCREKVLGVAFDGTGYGPDGRLWGGEFLLADLAGYERLGHCRYLPLPGGAKAIREPWRQAAWVMQQLYGDAFASRQPVFARQLPAGFELVLQATTAGLNAPLTSSAGRLFDTAAALLGLRLYNTFEGQAAIELEAAAAGRRGCVLPYELTAENVLDFCPSFAALLAGLEQGRDRTALAADFHATVAAAAEAVVRRLARQCGVRTVALSGGVFQNMTLLRQLVARLQGDFTVLVNRQVPANDGGISLGQAAVARERSW